MPLVTMPDGEVVNMPDQLSPEQGRRLRAMLAGKPAESKFSLGSQRSAWEGILEPALTMATGMIAEPIGNIIGAGKEILTGDFGKGTAEKTAASVKEALTYAPRSKKAQERLGIVGQIFADSKLAGLPFAGNELPMLGTLAKPATQQVGAIARNEVGMAASAADKALTKISPFEASAQRAMADPENAARVAAANTAQKLGIALNPEEALPSVGNRIRSLIGGSSNIDRKLAMKNLYQWTRLGKQDLGMEPGTVMDIPALKQVRKQAAQSSEEISKIAAMSDDGTAAAEMSSLRMDPSIPGMETAANAANQILDDLAALMKSGMTGEQTMSAIRTYRKMARDLYKKNDAGEIGLAKADAFIGAARSLEKMVEQNLEAAGKSDLLAKFRADRTLQAKSYAYEGALDANRKIIDPAKIARMTKADSALTGVIKDIGNVAGMWPDIAKVPTKIGSSIPEHLSRATLGASGGALLASHLGGSLAEGGLLGAFGGELAGMMMRQRIASDSYQRNMMPKNPFAANIDASTMRGIYTPRTPAMEGEVIPGGVPNWTFYQEPTQAPQPKLLQDGLRVPNEVPPTLQPFAEQKRLVDAELVKHRAAMAQAEAEAADYARWAKEAADKFNAAKNERANNPQIMSAKERAMNKLMKREASRRMQMEQKMRAMKDHEAQLVALQAALERARPSAIGFQGPKTREAQRGLLTGEQQ